MANIENPCKSSAVWKFSYSEAGKSTVIESPTPMSTVRDAIEKAKLGNVPFKDTILFAEVADDVVSGEVAIPPEILCHKLENNTKIRHKKKKGAVQKNENDDESIAPDKENEDPSNGQKLFYVNSTTSGITKVPNTTYEGKPLCVVIYANDHLNDAISRDGRFAKQLMLLESDDRKSEIPLHYKAVNYAGKVLTAKKRPPKRKSDGRNPDDEFPSVEEPSHSLPDNLSDPLTEVVARAMMDEARKDAFEAFSQPRSKGNADDRIKRMVQMFGKKDSSSIYARILDTLVKAKASIGFLRCGDYGATCWLLYDNAIITSRHVFNDISKLRSNTTDQEIYGKILVDFDYNDPGKHGKNPIEIDESQEKVFGEGTLDYAIFLLKDSPDPLPLGLGYLVRLSRPCPGHVVLLGHPEKKAKQLEICQVIPGYKWHAELCERGNEAMVMHDCNLNPEKCVLNPSNIYSDEIVKCIHMYQGREFNPAVHSDQIPYDTSFFHGASGSPVFNACGHIIAMHTMGYPFYQAQKKCSLMEFGITFAAIYNDVKQRRGITTAKKFFPEVEDLP